ncbi:MAG TPA: glycosyltransferase family 4 protein [Anaerolineales bacterium]|nr:glycosyltransferase family 4 protein [Anaerolineales bacterium]
MSSSSKATVLIIGGPDVDARLDFMNTLRSEFELIAAGSLPKLEQRFTASGFKYHVYPLHRGISPVSDLFSAYHLWRLCGRVRPQIVHTFDSKPCVWGRLAARWAGVPVILGTLPGLGSLYARDSVITRLVRAIYQPLQKLACDVSQLTIFQNRDDARQFIAAGVVAEGKAIVIPGSGVPTDMFSPGRVSSAMRENLRNELDLKPGETVVTMISRVIRAKGIPEFMAAAQEISARRPDVRFLLVGPEDTESIDRLNANELAQLKQAVTWPGPRRDVPTVLALSDIFVLPSAYREGIPRVLLEAAAMGLPIVTTNSPGCSEVVEDGVNGYLVPVRDAPALSQAILRLLEQRELRQRFGQASRQRVVERFDLSVIVKQMRSVYYQLLAEQAPLLGQFSV